MEQGREHTGLALLLHFLVEEGRGTHGGHKVSWQVEVGWPHYFLQRDAEEERMRDWTKISHPQRRRWGKTESTIKQCEINPKQTENADFAYEVIVNLP